MWYLINSWKVLSENPQPPSLKKSKNPLPPKNSKSVGHPFFSTSKIFQPLPAERGRRILWNSLFLTTDHYLHFLGKALTNRVRMYLAYLKLQIAIFDHLLIVRSQAHVFNFLRTWSNFKKLSIHKKNFMVPFHGWSSAASRLESQFEEAVYFIQLSFQKFLILLLVTSEGWKAKSTLEPPSDFEHGTLEFDVFLCWIFFYFMLFSSLSYGLQSYYSF